MPTRHVQVRLEDDEYQKLQKYAEKVGKSLQVCMRSIVLDGSVDTIAKRFCGWMFVQWVS